MISFARIGNNLLFIGILAVVAYMVYMKLKSQSIKDKIKGAFSREKFEKLKIGKGRLGKGEL